MATATVPGLQDGIDGGVNDDPPQMPAWNRTGNQLGMYNGQSDRAPPPVV